MKMVVHNLPYAAAPFVNRVSEIAEITHQLSHADCRLLTLVGPGGIGKTRLAMRVALDCADQFDDGVFFIPLQPLDSPEFIVSAIISVVNAQFRPRGDPKQELFQYLREKVLLMMLDNFEHLLDGAELLTELLEAAPEIKLLVTSREVLNLQEEWLYRVDGLHYPETADTDQPGAYSAVQLFLERARKVSRDLALADEQAAVIRVCQLVEGMPLALELAAGWARTLPPKEIASEIQRSLDILSTSLRNVPQRHQSITAVFEQTWRRLSEEERRVFQALSVFNGGFRREAASVIANVSVRVLSSLADKSLLTRQPNGRHQIHELLRQYAQTQLETRPEEKVRVHELHSAYYVRFLSERDEELSGGRQLEASLEIEAELDNIRAAWSWAVDHARIEALEQAEYSLMLFYTPRSRFLEGTDTFAKAIALLDDGDPDKEIALAKMLCAYGWIAYRRGDLETAQVALERSWQIYSRNDLLPRIGKGTDPRHPLSALYVLQGNFRAGETLAQNAVRDHTLRNDPYNLAFACETLAYIYRAQGKYREAREYAQQAYRQTLLTSDESFRTYCLMEWGRNSLLLGDTVDAKRRLQAAYDLRKDFGDPKGMADLLTILGRIALLEGDYKEANRCYEQVRSICSDLGDDVGLAAALEGMGDSARALGHYGDARRYFCEAIQITNDQTLPRFFSILVGIGELLLQTGRNARAIELLALALHHPASDQDTRNRAQQLLSRYQATKDIAEQSAMKVDFDAFTATLLHELQQADERTLTRHTPNAGETLIEPLSERELAVVTLMAEGLSNHEIANRLFLSVATVKWYLTHIYSKLGVQGRSLAIVRVRQLNLLP